MSAWGTSGRQCSTTLDSQLQRVHVLKNGLSPGIFSNMWWVVWSWIFKWTFLLSVRRAALKYKLLHLNWIRFMFSRFPLQRLLATPHQWWHLLFPGVYLYPVVSGTPLFFQIMWGLGFPATWHWKTTLPPSTRHWALGLLTKEGGVASPPLVTSTTDVATATLQEDHTPPLNQTLPNICSSQPAAAELTFSPGSSPPQRQLSLPLCSRFPLRLQSQDSRTLFAMLDVQRKDQSVNALQETFK